MSTELLAMRTKDTRPQPTLPQASASRESGRLRPADLDGLDIRQTRTGFVYLLAILGVLQWLAWRWAAVVPNKVSALLDAVWLPCLVGTVALLALEVIFAYRRRGLRGEG